MSNSVAISNPTSGKNLYGPLFVEPWLSTQTRVRVSNLAASGSTTSDCLRENGATFWGGVDLAKALTPDLTIIDLGLLINDRANSISIATSIANLQTIITAAQVSGDVLLEAPMPLSSNSAIGMTNAQQAADLAAVIAAFPTLPFIDTFNALGGTADAYVASGDMAADNIHGGDAMYGDEAQMLAGFFRSL